MTRCAGGRSLQWSACQLLLLGRAQGSWYYRHHSGHPAEEPGRSQFICCEQTILGPLRRGLRLARYHRRRGGLKAQLERRLDHHRVVYVSHSVREGEKRSDRSLHIGCWRVDTESMAGKSRTC